MYGPMLVGFCGLKRTLISSPGVCLKFKQCRSFLTSYRIQNTMRETIDVTAKKSEPFKQKSIDVAILGAPNAGKSTLLNLLVGGKVSAVSPKRNTTRDSVLGILSDVQKNTQVVFYDTPGYVDYRDSRSYIRELYVTARDTIGEVDIAMVIVDAAKRFDDTSKRNFEYLINKCLNARCPIIIVMNKVDLVHPKPHLLLKAEVLHNSLLECQERLLQHLKNRSEKETKPGESEMEQSIPAPIDVTETRFFMISAAQDDGVDDVKKYLFSLAQEREWDYEEDDITEFGPEELVSEIIREQLYNRLHKEIPYRVQQNTRCIENTPGKIWLSQELVVPNESQKRIIQGKQGKCLSSIESSAAKEAAKALKKEIRIDLNVKVKRRR